MLFRSPDPQVEEAIAVIEALARVPQQEHKWGREAVAAAWPSLHGFYYATVISDCVRLIKNSLPNDIMSLNQRIIVVIRRRFRAKPGYYP